MATERMQLLISSEQKARLKSRADELGLPTLALIREAIDQLLALPTNSSRLEGLRRIKSMQIPALTPQQIEEVLDAR